MKLDWRRVMLYATITGMEGCWLYGLLFLLNEPVADGGLSIPGLLALYPLAFGINRLLRRQRWRSQWRHAVSWLLWAIAVLLTVKIQLYSSIAWSDTTWLLAIPRALGQIIYTFEPELLILLSSGLIWWLGQRLAYIRVNFRVSLGEFQFGMVVLGISFLASHLWKMDLGYAIPLALYFFCFALLGMSLAHAMESKSWLAGWHKGRWSVLLLVCIALILVIGLIIGMVITRDLVQLVVNAANWVWQAVINVIGYLLSLLPEAEPTEPLLEPPISEAPQESAGVQWWQVPESLKRGFAIALIVMLGGGALAVLWVVSSRILRWLRQRLGSMQGAEIESLPGAFSYDLRQLLQRLLALITWRWLFRQRQSQPAAAELDPVRQVYHHFLRWAEAGGYPRQAWQTPEEYRYALATVLPVIDTDISFITGQYISARYGPLPPTANQIERTRQHWQQLGQHRLKNLIKGIRKDR